jgi:hypothetical protein
LFRLFVVLVIISLVIDLAIIRRLVFICQVQHQETTITWKSFGKTELYSRAVVSRETKSHRR